MIRNGSMSVRVEGKITALLGFSESEHVHAILSCTSPRAGQYRVNDQWSLSTTFEPSTAFRRVDGYGARLEYGSLRHDRFLFDELGRAKSPLTAADLARSYLCGQGVVATVELVLRRSHTYRERLHALRKLNRTALIRLPGKERQGWVLAERRAELDRPLTRMNSMHGDNELVFAELNRASRPLTINDFVRAVVRNTGERPTPSRINSIKCRLRLCLSHHRRAGLLLPLNMPGNSAYGWVLAERAQELRPLLRGSIKDGPLDALIRATTISNCPTSTEMAAQVFGKMDQPRTKRRPTLRSVTNRVRAYLRDHRRNGDVRPVVIKGKKAQGWEWIAGELIDPEATE